MLEAVKNGPVDCACVIHGSAYEWIYVEKLYAMLSRNISQDIRMHVWTEPHRSVPEPFIKHDLVDWPGVGGPRKSWWYKMQMFDPNNHHGRLLYFDLDVIILQNIDWMLDLDLRYFWSIRDFRHYWRGAWDGINSSCMIWHIDMFAHVWQDFSAQNIQGIIRRFPGDQDYLNTIIDNKLRRYLDPKQVKSWRWEIKDGGMDFKKRVYRRPDAGSIIPPETSVMIFHGQPKPHEITDPTIQQLWG